jgi:hypothetical protein
MIQGRGSIEPRPASFTDAEGAKVVPLQFEMEIQLVPHGIERHLFRRSDSRQFGSLVCANYQSRAAANCLAGPGVRGRHDPGWRYVFISLGAPANAIAVIRQKKTFAAVAHMISTCGPAFGLAITNNGRYLLAAVQAGTSCPSGGVQFIDVRKAIAGDPAPRWVRFQPMPLPSKRNFPPTIPFGAGVFPRQWAVSPNGRWLYLTEYISNTLAIFRVSSIVHQVQ